VNFSQSITLISVVFFILFAVREFVAYKKILFLKYLLTPLITLCIIMIPLLGRGFTGFDNYTIFIVLSLLFALIADTLLMIEEHSYLKNGILFFMMSHVLYALAFSSHVTFRLWNVGLIILILAVNFFHLRMMKKHAGKMFLPVSIYVVVIDIMGYLAITKLNNGFGIYEISVASAAILFWISDFILSINAFVRPIPNSTVYTWLFYGPAQFLFALSTLSFVA